MAPSRVELTRRSAGAEAAKIAPFRDRSDAGIRLAKEFDPSWHGRPDVVVVGLPRGGVPVAYEVARALDVPLDVLVVRKLGVPGHEELAFGAVASGGVRVLNPDLARSLPPSTVEDITARERRVLEAREASYRDGRPPIDLGPSAVVIVVDDGLATGASMRAAVTAVRQRGPATIVVAVPVGAAATCELLGSDADVVVCALTPEPFVAVGAWYADFSPTSDEEVRRLLDEARARG